MKVELVSQFRDGRVITTPISASNGEVGNLFAEVENPTSLAFGPCHSPLAGMGCEKLILRGNSSLIDEKKFSLDRPSANKIVKKQLKNLPGPSLVSVGHYVPSSSFVDIAPENAIDSIRESDFIIKALADHKKEFAFLVVVNDIKLVGVDRLSLYENYKLPHNLRNALTSLQRHTEKELRVIVVSESKLVERLSKDRKRILKATNETVSSNGKIDALKELFGNNGDHAAKCIRGFARLPKLPEELGYESLIQLMPKCGAFNAHKGYSIGARIFGEVPSIMLYRTFKCW